MSDLPGFRHLADDDLPPAAARRAGFAEWTGEIDDPLVMHRSAAEQPNRRRRPAPIFIGGGLIFAVAALLAAPLALRSSHRTPTSPLTGLKVTRGEPGDTPVTPRRSLPCYVDGLSVGNLPLMDCAARNGVASGSLDNGLSRPALHEAPLHSGPVEAARAPLAASPRALPPASLARAAGRPLQPYDGRESSSEDDLLHQPPSSAESAQAAQDFYRALGEADGARAASLVVPEKRRGGPLSASAIDRFYSSLQAPLRIIDLRPLDNRTVAVRYQFVDPEGVLCSGASEVATTVRDGRVLVEGIRTQSRC